jgi:hypothetical protein
LHPATATPLSAVRHCSDLIDDIVVEFGNAFYQDTIGRFIAGQLVGIIEQRTGVRIYTITDLVPFAEDPGGLASKLSRYPRDTVIPTAGTWLRSFDAGLAVPVLRKARNGTQLPKLPPTHECGQASQASPS